MIPIPPKLIIAGIVLVAVSTTIFLGYHHYTSLIDDVRVLSVNNAELKTAVDLQKDTIEQQGAALGEWSAAQTLLVVRVEELQQVAEDAAQETRRLNDVFSRHDLTDLAQRRPGLIERRINTGTDSALGMLECISSEAVDCSGGDREAPGTSTTP